MLRSQNVAIRIPLFICNFVILNMLQFMINCNKFLIISNHSKNYISYLAISVEIAMYCYYYYQWDICFRLQRIPLCKISNNLRNAIKFMKCFIKTNFLSSQRNINKEMLHQVHICKKSRSVDRLKSFPHVFFISFPVKRQFAATYSSQHAFVFNMTDTVSSLKLWRRRLFTPLH